tara:strand:- start:727 stop:885 length:159 start_codon:yes stop_codon:yes gene_type:complete
MKKPYKIKILGGAEDGKTKGFFTEVQIPKVVAMLTVKNGKDWAYNIQEVNEK